MTPRTRAFALMLLIGFGAPAAALFTQYGLDMQPCAWCVLQRLIFVGIAFAGLAGLVWSGSAGRVVAALAAFAFAASGIAAAGWQHFVASKSTSCNLTLADRIVSALRADTLLPSVFAPQASCADAAVQLMGMPYEFWSFLLFVVLALVAAWTLVRGRG